MILAPFHFCYRWFYNFGATVTVGYATRKRTIFTMNFEVFPLTYLLLIHVTFQPKRQKDLFYEKTKNKKK